MDISHVAERKKEFPEEFSFEQFRFKRVEVMSAGILYRGVLIGADSQDLFLKGSLRWLILPLDRIAWLRLEGHRVDFNIQKCIEPSFYYDPA